MTKTVSKLISTVFLAVLTACGDSTAPPTGPLHIDVASGDNQAAEITQPLPLPITVTVTTEAGAPVAGYVVNWAIASGNGTLSASTSTTDAAGHATVNWTLGGVTGEQKVHAWIQTTVVPFFATGLGHPVPRVLHYDGSAWTVALKSPAGETSGLNAIWGASTSAIFAVGSQCRAEFTWRYDGSSWSQPAQICGVTGPTDFVSLGGTSAADLYVVDQHSLAPARGSAVMHFDGQTWTTAYHQDCSLLVVQNCNPWLNSVWSAAPGEAVVVGESGSIVRYDGAAWTPQTTGTTNELFGVWGTGTGPTARSVAVGSQGTILSFDGSSWTAQASGTTQTLYAVWGSSASDIFAVGDGGTILHYDGSAWTSQTSGSTATLRAVWGSGSVVYAVGYGSTILRYDGAHWTSQAVPVAMNLRGVWGTSPTNVWAVGVGN